VTCERDDPEINTCIQQAIQIAVPNLVKGEWTIYSTRTLIQLFLNILISIYYKYM
jgi:hypothetical protein